MHLLIRLAIVALLIAGGYVSTNARPLHGGATGIAPASALQTLVAGMAHNSWKKLNVGPLSADQLTMNAANFDGGYVATTGSWSASSSSITVTSAAGIIQGQSVFGTGIPSPDWVTSVTGTTIGLYSNTTGSSGGTVAVTFQTLSQTAGQGCGTSNVWSYSSPAVRTDVGKVKLAIMGGGHSDGCDGGLYTFDAEACAASINLGGTANCHWQNPVPGGRTIPAYFLGNNYEPPSWSCQNPDTNYRGLSTFSSGASTIVININKTNYGTGGSQAYNSAPASQWTGQLAFTYNSGALIWGPGIAPNTTYTISSVTGYQVTIALSTPTTANETNAQVMVDQGDGATYDLTLATTTAGSATVTLASLPTGWQYGGFGSTQWVSGPTIGAGSTIVGGSGSGTTFTMNQPAILSQTNGPIFLGNNLGYNFTNKNGTETQGGEHTYYAAFPIPGTTQWIVGDGGFGAGPNPSNGAGQAYIYDDGANTYAQIGGVPSNCFIGYLTTGGSTFGSIHSSAVNDLDGVPWTMIGNILENWTVASYASVPVFNNISTYGGGTSVSIGQSQIVFISDPVNGSANRALFIDLSESNANQFVVWTGIGANACPVAPASSCVENTGTFSATLGSIFTASCGISNCDPGFRGICSDGTYVYEWDGNGIIAKITPQASMSGWPIAALNSSPTGDVPAQAGITPGGVSENVPKLSCLGPSYSGAFLAFVGTGTSGTETLAIYKP